MDPRLAIASSLHWACMGFLKGFGNPTGSHMHRFDDAKPWLTPRLCRLSSHQHGSWRCDATCIMPASACPVQALTCVSALRTRSHNQRIKIIQDGFRQTSTLSASQHCDCCTTISTPASVVFYSSTLRTTVLHVNIPSHRRPGAQRPKDNLRLT